MMYELTFGMMYVFLPLFWITGYRMERWSRGYVLFLLWAVCVQASLENFLCWIIAVKIGHVFGCGLSDEWRYFRDLFRRRRDHAPVNK
jgi:hypothetical protein